MILTQSSVCLQQITLHTCRENLPHVFEPADSGKYTNWGNISKVRNVTPSYRNKTTNNKKAAGAK